MKILLISHSPDNRFGGASRIYHLLAGSLAARGHSVSVHHGEEAGITAGGIAGKLKQRLAMPSLVSKLGKRLNAQDFDVVMTSSGTGAPLYAELAKKGGPRPLTINHIHGLGLYDDLANRSEEWIGNWPTSAMYKLVTGRAQKRWDWQGVVAADLTVVQNRRDLDWVERRLPTGSEVAFIPAALHPELMEMSEDWGEGAARRDTVVWFATWEARKGAAYVPRAFRKLRAARPEMRLIVAGVKQPPEEIRAQFAAEDRGHIEFPGFVTIEQQAQMLREAAIFLFPSVSEGFGLALVEAMAFGAVAVTTNTAFGGDFLTDGDSARVVPLSSEHIGQAMIELCNDPVARSRMAAKGREIARSFTLERMTDAYETQMLRRVGR